MGLTKVPAKDYKFSVKKNGDYIPIGCLTSFTKEPRKNDADISCFDSGGWGRHTTTRRGYSYVLEGHWLETPLVEGKPGAMFIVTHGAEDGGNITISEDNTADFVVAVEEGDTPWEVAVKIALIVNAREGYNAKSAVDRVVIWREDGEPCEGVEFEDTGTTLVTIGTVQYSGDRDPGQAEVDALASLTGLEGIGDFKVESPGGEVETFKASVAPSAVGGGEADDTSWGATLVVTGAITKS